MKDYIFTGNALYYWDPKTWEYKYEEVHDITEEELRNMESKKSERDLIDALCYTPYYYYTNPFVTTMPKCENKPEYSKMYKPKKKTKRGFDEMLISDKIRFTVDKIYLNGSHTCVVWKDGTKTVVNCADGDYYDEYAAFAAALAKKIYGNNTALKRMLEEKTVVQKPFSGKDWREPVNIKFDPESISSVIHDACKKLNNALRKNASDEKKDND